MGIGIALVVVGLLQAAGAISGSAIYRALPHFQRSESLLGQKVATMIHAVIGSIVVIVGVLIVAGVIKI